MINLLKYELKKRKSTLILGAIILIAIEGLTLYLLNKKDEYVIFAFILMVLMLVGVVFLVFLDVAVQYYNDFKKAQGTLLFLTPNSGRKVVGSKMLFGALELFAGLGIFVLFAWITNTVAVNLGHAGVGPQIREFIDVIGYGYGESNTGLVITGFLALVFLQYLASQSVAISSITLGRTILSRNSYNWLWAILIFFVVNIAIQTINSFIVFGVGMSDGLFSSTYFISGEQAEASLDVAKNLSKYFIIGGVQYIFWIVVSFFLSSMLLNKKIDI